MKKSIRINIPEPCHENWAQMTPTEKGKFCSSCAKEVFDFTHTTDEDLVKRLHNGKDLCGRFNTTQLDREITLERKSKTGLLPYAASLLIPLSLLHNPEAKAESKYNSKENTYTSIGIGSNPAKAFVTITGIISDEAGKPIPGALIIVDGTDRKTTSDENGFYQLKCASESRLVYSAPYKEMVVKQLEKGFVKVDITLSELRFESMALGRPVMVNQTEQELIQIRGQVHDENGLPMAGVNVVVKDSDRATQTDFGGNYSIETEANQKLVFTYLGYETQEVTTSNISNTFNIALQPSQELLGDVMVVAGGIHIIETPKSKSKSKKRKKKFKR